MTSNTTRRRFLQAGALATGIGLAGCTGVLDGADDYEVWALDQGTGIGYIYEPDEGSDEEFSLLDTIDFGAYGGDVPHMVDFSSDDEYAAIACTAGARTIVVRCEDREVVGNIETGPGSHFAGFGPDDSFIQVDVIGEGKIKRIDVDLEDETFGLDGEIDVISADAVQAKIDDFSVRQSDDGDEFLSPVCHDYANGVSYHTLGPGHGNAGLVVVSVDDFEIVEAFPPTEIPVNCGTIAHPDENKFYLTAGLPSNPDEDAEGLGEYFVLDSESHDVIERGDTGGIDAHGFWFTAGDSELWVLNRETNDGLVIDPETDEVIDEIDAFGPEQGDEPDTSDAPDIMWGSPDDQYMFVTLRGSNPVSGAPHAATGVNPGFSVMDVESREIQEVIQPDPDNEDSDFHGIGVRRT